MAKEEEENFINDKNEEFIAQKKYYMFIYFLFASLLTQSELSDKFTKFIENNRSRETAKKSLDTKQYDDLNAFVQSSETIDFLNIYTFSVFPSMFHYFLTTFGNESFIKYLKNLKSPILLITFSRSAFFSPLFINYIYKSFCPILSPLLSTNEFNNKDINEIRENILKNCEKNSTIFPNYISDILLINKKNIFHFYYVFIVFLTYDTYKNISFQQILGIIEPNQIVTQEFLDFLKRLFDSNFINKLYDIFVENKKHSKLIFFNENDTKKHPEIFEPIILSNYDIEAMKHFHSTFERIDYKLYNNNNRRNKNKNKRNKSNINDNEPINILRNFMLTIDMLPKPRNDETYESYIHSLTYYGDPKKEKERKESAERAIAFIKENKQTQLYKPIQSYTHKSIDKIRDIYSFKHDLKHIKLILNNVIYNIKFVTYTAYVQPIIDKADIKPLDFNIENDLNDKFRKLVNIIKVNENNKNIIDDEFINRICYTYLTKNFNFREFKKKNPKFKEIDQKIFGIEFDFLTKLKATLDEPLYKGMSFDDVAAAAETPKFKKAKQIICSAKDYIQAALNCYDLYTFGYKMSNVLDEMKSSGILNDVDIEFYQPVLTAMVQIYKNKEIFTRYVILKEYFFPFFEALNLITIYIVAIRQLISLFDENDKRKIINDESLKNHLVDLL